MSLRNKSSKPHRLSNEIEAKLLLYVERLHAEGRILTVTTVVEHAQREDHFFRRQKKAQLEKTAQNVIRAFKRAKLEEAHSQEEDLEDQNDDESDVNSEFDNKEGVQMMEVKDTNAMNRSVTTLWNIQKSSLTHSIPTAISANPAVLEMPIVQVTSASPQQSTPKRRSGTLSAQSKSKRLKSSLEEAYPTPFTRLEDMGGIDDCIREVEELIILPIKHPEIYIHTGVDPPRGILLHGPPGCGKTMLAHAIAGNCGVPFLSISAPSVVSGMSGESEKKIREVFDEAKQLAPCILFIDEIDAITPKRETAQREMERRIVAQLLTCMDDLSFTKTNHKPVMIIGATNRPDSLDPALRRAGRFDREIAMGVPDDDARERILRVMASKLRLESDFDFHELARLTPGYVGADLQALVAAAGIIAVKRIFKHLRNPHSTQNECSAELAEMDLDSLITTSQEDVITTQQEYEAQSITSKILSLSDFLRDHPDPLTPAQLASLSITLPDFLAALKKVQPSSKREGFATVPDVTWSDIGALGYVRDELRMAVVEPINHPEFFERVGISAPVGVLLWGPPGCGKTLLAKAVANESRTNFISIKGPELLNKYVGESERGVRQVFARARASAPCVVFFDEIDALCGRRDDSQSDVSARIVNTLLTELDGMENRKQVYVIAATNRPDMIDSAMLRPGRLDKLLYVELPTCSERLEILRTLTTRIPLAPKINLETIVSDPRCDGFSGADIAALVREAGVTALREVLYQSGTGGLFPVTGKDTAKIFVTEKHFETAFLKIGPSVSKQDKRHYDLLRIKFGCATSTRAAGHSLKSLTEADVVIDKNDVKT